MSESRSRPSTTATNVSKRTDSTLERAIGGSTLPGKGELLYTGPEGVRNHLVRRLEHRYVGIGSFSDEQTAEAFYLQRPAQETPFPNSKQASPGSIGWGLPVTGDPRSWPLHLQISSEEELKTSEENFKIIFHRR
ncbi:uncharacterized protein [Apostichopus japonicus]|uniref:uncharacterized protein n=1 Tax=Stichopus japonicus TaxID=307972 RepID=UPI003AB899AC